MWLRLEEEKDNHFIKQEEKVAGRCQTICYPGAKNFFSVFFFIKSAPSIRDAVYPQKRSHAITPKAAGVERRRQCGPTGMTAIV